MTTDKTYIDVILPFALEGTFTYHLPSGIEPGSVVRGMRVVVQFGKKKLYTALVFKKHLDAPAGYETKPILTVLDNGPVVNEWQLKLWNWIAGYYLCTQGEIFQAAMPTGFKLASESRLFVEDLPDEGVSLNNNETSIVRQVEANPGISIQKLVLIKDTPFNIFKTVKKLLERRILSSEERLKEKAYAKTRAYIKLNSIYRNSEALHDLLQKTEKRAPKQYQLLLTYFEMEEELPTENQYLLVPRSDILKRANLAPNILKALIDKNIFVTENREISRFSGIDEKQSDMPVLSNDQTSALKEIKAYFSNKQPVLLHGVTSSGKTEIYIRLIEEQINKGKQVLYLLPEIALTAQIIYRLRSVFGTRVGVYHSKFSDAERIEIWQNLLGRKVEGSPDYQIILGVRSSVFLPFTNLGLVIVDEEHETTYKQFDPAPRYHARDTAIVLATMFKANILLGTATPSLETYFNVQLSKYAVVELQQRFKNINLPEIEVVDLKEARRKKLMQAHFTPQLVNLIRKTLDEGQQIILFQNRRGFSIYMECDQCGTIPQCRNCDVSLTYHKQINKLVCHYCGYSIQKPVICPSCGSEDINTRGFGTEKIEDEIRELFPDARIARMDLDSTRSKKSYERIISDFENKETDILIGTQMISKGLDFNHVKVVGILNADNLLNFPDFRSHERGFHLMAQVSGRAGRKSGKGKVVIQTADISKRIIQQVVGNNYQQMFNEQIQERIQFHYPPAWRLIRITLKHKDTSAVNKSAYHLVRLLRSSLSNSEIIGPQSPLISRIQGLFQQCILVKSKKSSAQNEKQKLKLIIDQFKQNSEYKKVSLSIDVDPY